MITLDDHQKKLIIRLHFYKDSTELKLMLHEKLLLEKLWGQINRKIQMIVISDIDKGRLNKIRRTYIDKMLRND